MAIMPPRIVIALTGPIGSGCSTLARFFDDLNSAHRNGGNRFLNQLIEKGVILNGPDGLEVRWEDVNREVSAKLAEYHRVKGDHKISGGDGEGEVVSGDERSVFKELGRLLERRESLKALTFLKPYYPKGSSHLFRTLSMSDIIVFRALRRIALGENSMHVEFDDLAKKAIEYINHDLAELKPVRGRMIRTVAEFYDAMLKSSTFGLIRAFQAIHRQIRTLKAELLIATKGKDTNILQEFGNSIRRCGNPFASKDDSGDPKKYCAQLAQDMEKVIDLIYRAKKGAFFVIDCLRNPQEALYFRQRFPLFYCVSIYAEKDLRFQRRFRHLMTRKGIDPNREEAKSRFDEIDSLDSGGQIAGVVESMYKQDVTRCVQMSDYAISNMASRPDTEAFLHSELLRFVSLVLCPGSSKPRKDEVYMNMAYAMAVKSNCICRQVGAVIAGKDDYIIGAGWNDVAGGAISCGLRNLADLDAEIHRHIQERVRKAADPKLHLEKDYESKLENEHTAYPLKQACFCFKDEMAQNEVPRKLRKELHGCRENDYRGLVEHEEDMFKAIGKAGLHQLEYCLALHAEENAVIQGSRIGGIGVRGGTIYVTAQPCTLCAKMLKQAGILRVVYTDPYPKSLAKIFSNGVKTRQFEGVKPLAYIRLFMPSHDQKEWQDLEVQNMVPGFDLAEQKYLYDLG